VSNLGKIIIRLKHLSSDLSSIDDKVWVVIPVHNSEKFLNESIDSVLDQTYKNIEILAVNDGSTDHSYEILQQYSDKISIISQSNQGLASALNVAIKKINGKWFKWFSPDDILYPNAIEVLVKGTKSLPENTIVYSNWELIDENGNKLRNFSESNYNNLEKFEFNVRLLDGQQINVNTTLIPFSLFERGCLIRNLKDPVAIDYDFFVRAGILYDTSFQLIPQVLLKYRVSPHQLSHKNIAKTMLYLSEVRRQILAKLNDSKKEQYQKALKDYNKKKPLSKKTMEAGLKFTTSIFPDWVTDRLLVFYLNKIRRNR